jgi:hypothetical protein
MTQADVLFSEIPNLIFYCCAGDSFLIDYLIVISFHQRS